MHSLSPRTCSAIQLYSAKVYSACVWSIAAVGVTNTDESEKSFADARRRPCRPAPTVPPRPVPWLPMAMADLTGAVGIASRRARAQGSQPPSPVGDVGKCKQLRLLFARPQLFLAMPTLLPASHLANGTPRASCEAKKRTQSVRLVEAPAQDGDLMSMCMMSVGPQCGGCVCGCCVCDVHAWMPCRLGRG